MPVNSPPSPRGMTQVGLLAVPERLRGVEQILAVHAHVAGTADVEHPHALVEDKATALPLKALRSKRVVPGIIGANNNGASGSPMVVRPQT